MANETLQLVFYLLGIVVNASYGVCTLLLYKEYRYIKKEVSREVPKSVLYTLYYGCFIALTTFLAYVVGYIGKYDRLASTLAAQLWLTAAIGSLFLVLGIYEFSKSFPGKKIIKLSRILVVLAIIGLTSAIATGGMAIVQQDVPGSMELMTSLVSLCIVIAIPLIMAELASLSKGSLLSKTLKFLTIGYATITFFGFLTLSGVNESAGEDDPDVSNLQVVFAFVVQSMAFFGFYLIYRAVRVITDFFKDFGKKGDRGIPVAAEA